MNKFLIKHPWVTEKSTLLANDGKYVFLVEDNATRSEVKKAVESVYKVTVVKTNVVNARPKPKRFGRNVILKPGFKKVVVTLKKGEKLDILPH